MELYNKYRPKKLDEVVGNRIMLKALAGLLSKTPPHAFLFEGPTGCGKTTLARIVAKELKAIDDDFVEIDSADFRGIDTIRNLKRQSAFSPMHGKVRVFLIDECHKLTVDAQNALLKLLENPPKHAFFILATTDSQKLLKTIKGRCSRFILSLLGDEEMHLLLKRVVKFESGKVVKEAYERIINDSFGHPRNALQILEQVLAVPAKEQLKVAKRSAAEESQSIELCRALIMATSWKKVSNLLKGLKQEDAEGVRRHVLGYAQSVLLNKDSPKAAIILEEFIEPFYNSGFPGLVLACYLVVKG